MVRKFMRLPAVVEATGKSRSELYEDMAQGTFPQAVKVGKRAVGWLEDEVAAWQADRIAARDSAGKAR